MTQPIAVRKLLNGVPHIVANGSSLGYFTEITELFPGLFSIRRSKTGSLTLIEVCESDGILGLREFGTFSSLRKTSNPNRFIARDEENGHSLIEAQDGKHPCFKTLGEPLGHYRELEEVLPGYFEGFFDGKHGYHHPPGGGTNSNFMWGGCEYKLESMHLSAGSFCRLTALFRVTDDITIHAVAICLARSISLVSEDSNWIEIEPIDSDYRKFWLNIDGRTKHS